MYYTFHIIYNDFKETDILVKADSLTKAWYYLDMHYSDNIVQRIILSGAYKSIDNETVKS